MDQIDEQVDRSMRHFFDRQANGRQRRAEIFGKLAIVQSYQGNVLGNAYAPLAGGAMHTHADGKCRCEDCRNPPMRFENLQGG